ncbi:MAG TPA: hypothetical protein VFV49_13850, partial [Thermoanaerobaculia bacterium]|nr:hypothetical protein [Thermoanaerobaculia bacterium]
MTDDPFFERLRTDARTLRHQPDEATLARIRMRIQAHLEREAIPGLFNVRSEPTVAQLLAAWFRPLVAGAAALALVAAIGTSIVRGREDV